jgi:hypothetical protein
MRLCFLTLRNRLLKRFMQIVKSAIENEQLTNNHKVLMSAIEKMNN